MGIEQLKLDVTSKSAFMESFPDMKEWTKRGLAACVRKYVCSMFFLGGSISHHQAHLIELIWSLLGSLGFSRAELFLGRSCFRVAY